MRIQQILFGCALALLAAGFPSLAHQDPTGDVHPRVKALKDGFEITYWNNERVHADGGSSFEEFVLSLTRDGRPRGTPTKTREFTFDEHVRDLLLSKRYIAETDRFRIEEFGFLGSPSIEGKSPTGDWEEVELPWDGLEAGASWSAIIANDVVTMLVTSRADRSLHGAQFSLGAPLRMTALTKLGKPSWTGSLPVASKLVETSRGLAVAWVRDDQSLDPQTPKCEKSELVLTYWDPGTGRLEHEVIDTKVHWNTSVSIAATEDDLLVAYHVSEGRYCLEKGVIKVQHLSVEAPSD